MQLDHLSKTGIKIQHFSYFQECKCEHMKKKVVLLYPVHEVCKTLGNLGLFKGFLPPVTNLMLQNTRLERMQDQGMKSKAFLRKLGLYETMFRVAGTAQISEDHTSVYCCMLSSTQIHIFISGFQVLLCVSEQSSSRHFSFLKSYPENIKTF